MEVVYSQEQIEQFEKQRSAFLMVNPSDELHEIYIQSTIIETMGLRAGKITEKQNETYSKFIDLLQTVLKERDISSFTKLHNSVSEQLGREIKLPGKFKNYVPDIRQLDTIEEQLQYILDVIVKPESKSK